MHLVRNGQPVADVVPATESVRRMSHDEWQSVQQRARHMAALFGAPTLDHYRRVYESLQQPWPGDEEIRARYPVADAS